MGRFATFGNDLYTGRHSIDFMGRRRLWYTIAIAMTGVSLLALLVFRLNAGIEFRGGSEYTINKVVNHSQGPAEAAVKSVKPDSNPVAGKLGDGIRVSVEKLTADQSLAVQEAMAKAYNVPVTDVSASFIGPSWGGDISKRAIQGLFVFMLIVALVISLYFRTWKMAAAALIALVHDLIITVGVYSLTGFEVTPASVIGFLTILGYSLYDTVVVFDKVRENTQDVVHSTRRTFAEAANMAINQTLVRSINTSVVALLPVGSILFIGSFLLGAGTLKDISLALFVGIAAGTYSSIFIATPLLVDLRKNEPEIKAHDAKLTRRRTEEAAKTAAAAKDGSRPSVLDDPDDDDLPAGQPVTAGASVRTARSSAGNNAGNQAGTPAARPQRQQPKRSGRSGPGGRKR